MSEDINWLSLDFVYQGIDDSTCLSIRQLSRFGLDNYGKLRVLCRGYPVGRPWICMIDHIFPVPVYILNRMFASFVGEAPPSPYRLIIELYQYRPNRCNCIYNSELLMTTIYCKYKRLIS